MTAPRFDVGVIRTLARAMGTSPDAHDYVITDTASGRVKGIYATEALASAAIQRLVGTGGLYVLAILHPDGCDCLEAA